MLHAASRCIPVIAEVHMEGEEALLPASLQAQTGLSLVSVSLLDLPYEAGGARQKHAFDPSGSQLQDQEAQHQVHCLA